MLTQKEKIERLEMAIALLQDADAGMQAALGAGEDCYALHNAIEDIAGELENKIAQM